MGKYVENFESKYGKFHYAENKTSYSAKDCSDYLAALSTKSVPSKSDSLPEQKTASTVKPWSNPLRTSDDDSSSEITSPVITSPVKSPVNVSNRANGSDEQTNQHVSRKRNNSASMVDVSCTSPKIHKTNGHQHDTESGLGSDLCDLLEEKITKSVSESFAQLKNELQVKENEINRLENALNGMADEKKSLEQQFAAERERLKNEILALRQNSRMKTCFYCDVSLDQPNFCSTNCLK